MKTIILDIVHFSFKRIKLTYVFFSPARKSIPTNFFNNFSLETNFVAPVTMHTASCWIFFLISLPDTVYICLAGREM